MDKGQRNRWMALLGTLLLTVAAIFYPTEDDVIVTREAAVPRQTKVQRPNVLPTDVTEPVNWIAATADPFTSKGWLPPPPPQAATPPAARAVAVDAPPPPPLPYRFVGQMNDGTERVIYLSHGEQVVVARLGDLLEGTYKVVGLGATQIEFESASSGMKQMLAIPAQEN